MSHRELFESTDRPNALPLLELSSTRWLDAHRNVLITGPTGIGKSYLACALGNFAARAGYTVLYVRAPRLFETLQQARGDGCQSGATVIASQCPTGDWYPNIADPTLADAICDRQLHNAYRIELRGDSMRRNQDRPTASAAEIQKNGKGGNLQMKLA